jgi:hypothetical protein
MRWVSGAWRALRAALIVVVAGLSLAVVVIGLHHTWTATTGITRPAAAAARLVAFDLDACRESQFQREVPRGSRVYIAVADALLSQRLAEFASGWAVPTAQMSSAEFVVSPGPPGGGCDGPLGFVVAAR